MVERESEIIENNFYLTEEDLRNTLKNCRGDELSKIRDLSDSDKIDLKQLAYEIQKVKPKDHEQYVALLEVSAVYFLHATSSFDARRKNDVLWYTLQFEGSNLFDTAAKMIKVLKSNRNILYFSRKIAHVNGNGKLLGCLLIWDLSYKLLGEETHDPTPQFHSFSSLIKILDNVDIDLLPANVNLLHMLLECIGFLLNVIVVVPIKSSEYSKYLAYEVCDLSSLKEWILKISVKFPVSSNYENDVDVNSKISVLIDFIIKEYLSIVLKDNSLTLVNSPEISFNDSLIK